jgi:hypothetical protein
MAAFCPALRFTPVPGGAGGWWSGSVTPIRSTERLIDLLHDIHHHRQIYTVAGGELRHLPECRERHCSHPWMDRLKPEGLVRTFEVRLYYSGGHDDPRCWIAGIDLTNGRHMWSDGSICPFMSSSSTWDWIANSVADFVGHVSVWLVSWMIFQQVGVWIVGEHGNTPDYHLANIKPNNLCWCRSGKKYRKCHMQHDQALLWKMRR